MAIPEDEIGRQEYYKRLESVLENAPFTKHFLHADPMLPGWSVRLNELLQPIGKMVEQDLGEDFLNRVFQPFSEMQRAWGVFLGDRPTQQTNIDLVIYIGYELGDEKNAGFVRPMLIERMESFGWVAPHVAMLPDYTVEVVDRTILGLMNVGVLLRQAHGVHLLRELFGGRSAQR